MPFEPQLPRLVGIAPRSPKKSGTERTRGKSTMQASHFRLRRGVERMQKLTPRTVTTEEIVSRSLLTSRRQAKTTFIIPCLPISTGLKNLHTFHILRKCVRAKVQALRLVRPRCPFNAERPSTILPRPCPTPANCITEASSHFRDQPDTSGIEGARRVHTAWVSWHACARVKVFATGLDREDTL